MPINIDINQCFDNSIVFIMVVLAKIYVNLFFRQPLEQLFNWSWRDTSWIQKYSTADKEHPIIGFETVALPQGLVAAGFFANLVLLDFDRALVNSFGKAIPTRSNIVIHDACRYVDDMRLVFTVPEGTDENKIQTYVTEWLNNLLDEHAGGLLIETKKTKVTVEGREQHFLVAQSKTAARIQHDVSGTFDMLHGSELIGAIEGFFHTQQRYSQEESKATGRAGFLVGISDLRDDTAARFAAGKFRRVFRSLRPILDDSQEIQDDEEEDEDGSSYSLPKLVLSQQQLDERGKLFAAMLIEEWVTNPSNVRLLRIALDMYPEHGFLEKILNLLRDGWQVGGCKAHRKEVKQYCLAELFRAGATETGLVADDDCLPNGVDLNQYHARLTEEAKSVLEGYSSRGSSGNRFAWYLMQQVYLYLAARNETIGIKLPSKRSHSMLSLYQNFIGFLNGEPQYDLERRCVFSALAASAFGNEAILQKQKLSEKFIRKLALTAPVVAGKLWEMKKEGALNRHMEAARRCGLSIAQSSDPRMNLPEIASHSPNPFWEEKNLLLLAIKVAEHLTEHDLNSPWQIFCQIEGQSGNKNFQIPKIKSIEIGNYPPVASEFFSVPDWALSEDVQKNYKLGIFLRFALRGEIDFYRGRKIEKKKSPYRYTSPISHWEQLQHGGYHGRTAFAPEWIPVSSWMENLIFELLRWPGCGLSKEKATFADIKIKINERQKELEV